MTVNRDFDRELGAWFDEHASPSPPDGLLDRSLARVNTTRQRPGWLVRDRWLPLTTRTGRATALPAWAVLALLIVATVAVVVPGAALFLTLKSTTTDQASPSPQVSVAPSPATSPSPSVSPSPAPATSPLPSGAVTGGVIAFTRYDDYQPSPCPAQGSCRPISVSRLWTVNPDGKGLRNLFPDRPDAQISSMAWSPDGTHLIFAEAGRLYLTDVDGSDPVRMQTGCELPCVGDSDPAFSRDGTKLVFVRALASGTSIITTMGLASGRVVELGSIVGERPRWSPDGNQIAFSTYEKFGTAGTAVYVVDADGSNRRKVSPAGLPARSPDWSPDGSQIVFTSFENRIRGTLGKDAYAHLYRDVYAVRPDGTHLRRLTRDGVSGGATWTPDGRLIYVRVPLDNGNSPSGAARLWAMDADGQSAAQLVKLPGSEGNMNDQPTAQWQPAP